MPLPKPVLDSRTFDQLVTEGRAQLPRRATTWTDYNYSDPGITLLDLLSWYAEQAFYRFDRVSPEMLRAFLRLVRIEPRPLQVASSVLLISTSGAASVPLPDLVQISSEDSATVFETTRVLIVSPAILARVLAGAPPIDVTADNLAPFDPSRDPFAGTFLPFGPRPQRGAALALAFDRPLGNPGDEVSLHAWTPTPELDAIQRAAIIAEYEEAKAAAAVDCPGQPVTVPGWRLHYSVRTAWEYLAAAGWRPLANVDDETRALTLTGFVRFTIPGDHVADAADGFFKIRCRMTRGLFECPPRLDRVALNAVAADHAETIDSAEAIGVSRGHAREAYLTARAPVVPATTRLTLVHGADTDTTWREVAEWDEVGAHDPRYRIEYEGGRIETGNGIRGVVPPVDWTLQLEYRTGGGVAGNVAAGTLARLPASIRNIARIALWPLVSPGLSIAQPYAAFGGAAAEPLPHAQARAIEAVTTPQKAVTTDDFAALARRVPGVPVGRAYALPAFHPALPCSPAPGCVTVVVVPNCRGPRPVPGPDLLSAVDRFLDRRRLVTTDVHVVAPHYVGIVVHATLHLIADADPVEAAKAAQRSLDVFFDPLTGGPDGEGWPAGRGVYRTEVMARLATLAGVSRVTALGLQVEGEKSPRCGNVDICPTDLVASGRHRLTLEIEPAARALQRSVEHECP